MPLHRRSQENNSGILTPLRYLFIVLLSLNVITVHGQVYKYQDENGNWVFTDKKPTDQAVDTLDIQSRGDQNDTQLKFTVVHDQDDYLLKVQNPYYTPVEVLAQFKESGRRVRKVVPARSEAELVRAAENAGAFDYQWAWGDPNDAPQSQVYAFPIGRTGDYQISQGFFGRFSHAREPSLYAIDIAMPAGTDLVAAKAGVVFSVRDDYQFGGNNPYFLDKANHVNILHADGTYATYAHILVGSALVKPGDRVDVGQKIARSGSSGFSTGPHLHFVIRRNIGLRSASMPFQLRDAKGNLYSPRQGLVLEVR